MSNIDQLSLSFKDIELLLYSNHQMNGQIISFKALGVNRYLLTMSKEEQRYFIQEMIGRIIPSEKATTNNDLLNTLIHYFQENKNVTKTAEVMHIHQNTVYYRILQIEEKLHLDLNNIEHTMNLYAALFLYEFNKTAM